MPSLSDMLDDIMSDAGVQAAPKKKSNWDVTTDHEAQIMQLKEMYADYGVARFNRGDLVTAKANSGTRGAGLPHIVLDTDYGSAYHFTDDTSSAMNGRRHEIRVLCFVDNATMTSFWGESHDYELYDPDVHGK